MTGIPEHILRRKDDSPEEFKKQQDRIAEYVQDRLTKSVEDHANGGKS
jgi:hypothetical protein